VKQVLEGSWIGREPPTEKDAIMNTLSAPAASIAWFDALRFDIEDAQQQAALVSDQSDPSQAALRGESGSAGEPSSSADSSRDGNAASPISHAPPAIMQLIAALVRG
jgi:hypothetical protein